MNEDLTWRVFGLAYFKCLLAFKHCFLVCMLFGNDKKCLKALTFRHKKYENKPKAKNWILSTYDFELLA